MAGIIHLHDPARRQRGLTRRALVLGAASMAALGGAAPIRARQGTPGATASVQEPSAAERLATLLRLVPEATLGGPDPDQWLFTWVDLATHFAALGVTDWRDPNLDLVEVTQALAMTDNLSRFALDEEALATFGFASLDAAQILVAGNAPDTVTYYAGLSVDDLPSVWEEAGYERVQGEYGDFWTIGQEGEIDLQSPIAKFGVGSLNNAAILDGDVVVFARTGQLLQQVQALASGGGSAAADDPEIAALVATLPDDTVNVIVMPGIQLSVGSITPEGGQVTGEDLLAPSDEAVGPMPPIHLAGFGLTAGGRVSDRDLAGAVTPAADGGPNARFVVRLLTDAPEDAALAAEVVGWRVENMESPVSPMPYAELMELETPEDELTAGEVATLEFHPVAGANFWYQLLYSLDLWPFAWIEA